MLDNSLLSNARLMAPTSGPSSRPWPMFMPRLSTIPRCPSLRGMACVAAFGGSRNSSERDLSQLPARLGALRYGIARLHHAQLGISRKTLQNHIANLKAAIRHVLAQKRLSGRGIALTPRLEGLSMTNSPIGACAWVFPAS